jgi:hypothetical protein
MAQFTITVADEDLPLLQLALTRASEILGDIAPATEQELIQESFNQAVLPMWRRLQEEKTVIDIQSVLNDSDEETKQDAIQALAALQEMTPEQRKAALRAIRGNS